MATLVWDKLEDRRYEHGVSHGVLYPTDESGKIWNGLISVDESFVGGEQNSYYLDGVKYLDVIFSKNYQSTVNAFSTPIDSAIFFGEIPIVPGFRITKQKKHLFNFSYQTIFDDGYKIHLVYNILATQSNRGYSSIKDNIEPSICSWVFNSVPVHASNFKPSSHFVVDSTKANLDTLIELENILYGTDVDDSRFPSIDELVDLFTEVEIP